MKEITLKEKIISVIKNHVGFYPIITREIEKKLGLSNPVVLKGLKQLRDEGRVQTLRVTWKKGFRNHHKLTETVWPSFLFSKCFDCHNKSTIKTCIFHNDLSESGFNCDLTRVNTKLTKNTVACPWFIPRGGRRKEMPLEQFLKKSFKIGFETNQAAMCLAEETNQDKLHPSYHCLFCLEPLHTLGHGFIPLFGNSSIRCFNCESLYKLAYSEKKEKFVVLFAEEKGDLYRQNFEVLAGEPSIIEPYSSDRYGIVIPFEGFYQLDLISEVLVIANWIGKLSEMNYIVTRSKNDYHELKTVLAKNYSQISIIDGSEMLKSPQPTTHQIGLLRLLRKLKLLNKRFCKATLESRLTVLKSLKGKVDEGSRQQAIQVITNQLKKLSRYQLLTIKDWNHLDGIAANALWLPIAELAEKEGFDFPGRCLGRYVRDPFKPYSQYYAYSVIDSIINGLFLKTSESIKEYCTKINLCWDGLPGICHGETHGGEFGFHLDLLEPFKQAVLPILCKIIVDKQLEAKEVRCIYGRRRQKLYCIDSGSKLNKNLQEMLEQAVNQLGKNRTVKTGLEKYFFEIKIWSEKLVAKNFQNKISHHGQLFSYNVIIEYQIWQFLTDDQRNKIRSVITQNLQELILEPYSFSLAN
ncbi:MAG: hypothetical protein ACTSSH_02270 [Candidatus Heimdallarchaeota archaeon]